MMRRAGEGVIFRPNVSNNHIIVTLHNSRDHVPPRTRLVEYAYDSLDEMQQGLHDMMITAGLKGFAVVVQTP